MLKINLTIYPQFVFSYFERFKHATLTHTDTHTQITKISISQREQSVYSTKRSTSTLPSLYTLQKSYMYSLDTLFACTREDNHHIFSMVIHDLLTCKKRSCPRILFTQHFHRKTQNSHNSHSHALQGTPNLRLSLLRPYFFSFSVHNL